MPSSGSGSLLPTTAEGASSGAELFTSDGRSLALVGATLRGEAHGGLARLVLEQRFENNYAETLRVTYRMPLPADGAVSGYEFVIGERTIRGVIDRKMRARERFERAIASGKTAALLEQERADIFTQQVGNIPPREAVVVRITIDQRLVWLPEGEWELRFPTVIGPRYIGSADSAQDARATHVKVSDRPLTARIQIEIAIRDAITAGAKPNSPTHALVQRADGITELGVGARLDRDIVVRWPVAAPTVGISLAAARRGDAAEPLMRGNDAFALLTIVPPAPEAKEPAVPRDLIVLLDTSGSMSGGPLDKAKQVVAMMIDSLAEHDRLELIEFSDQPRRYLDEPVVATAKAKAAAIKWVRSRVADGGTEIREAVIDALQTLRVGAQRQVVVVTDGYVGGEQQILQALNSRLPKSCRLHVLGVGSAVNRSLATSLARAGRGAEVIVGIDEDAERGAKRLLDRTSMPMLTNVEIAGAAVMRHAPAQLPDVFAGAPLVCALAIKPEGGELVVRGQLARGTWEQKLVIAPLREGEGNQAIVALYGRERVADVEATALFASVDGEIEDLGMTFQIATRMTSWVAVDESRVVTGPTRDELVPQELPYGTKASAFGLRRAAATFARHDIGEMNASPVDHDEDEMLTAGPAAAFEADFSEQAPAELFQDEEPTGELFGVEKEIAGTAQRASQELAKAMPLAKPMPMKDAPAPAQAVAPEPPSEIADKARGAQQELIEITRKTRAANQPVEEKLKIVVREGVAPASSRASRWAWLVIAVVLLLVALLIWLVK